MRVLLVNKFNFAKGGADKFFLNLAALLSEKNIKVAKFCMKHPKNLTDENDSFFSEYLDFKKNFLAKKGVQADIFKAIAEQIKDFIYETTQEKFFAQTELFLLMLIEFYQCQR